MAQKVFPPNHLEPSPKQSWICLWSIFDKTGIDVNRLVELFATLDHLRTQLSILLELGESRLRVRYIESGHDIRINLEGSGEIIDSIRRFFLDLWTMIANREFDRMDHRNASIERGLEVIDKIDERVKAGTISQEDGERFKKVLLDDAFNLVDSGTMLTETPAIDSVDKRKLLGEARATKLLRSGELPEPNKK